MEKDNTSIAKKINSDFENLLKNKDSMLLKDSDILIGIDMKNFTDNDYKKMI